MKKYHATSSPTRAGPRALPSLVELSHRNCGLTELPAAIGQCASLKKLDLEATTSRTCPRR